MSFVSKPLCNKRHSQIFHILSKLLSCLSHIYVANRAQHIHTISCTYQKIYTNQKKASNKETATWIIIWKDTQYSSHNLPSNQTQSLQEVFNKRRLSSKPNFTFSESKNACLSLVMNTWFEVGNNRCLDIFIILSRN